LGGRSKKVLAWKGYLLFTNCYLEEGLRRLGQKSSDIDWQRSGTIFAAKGFGDERLWYRLSTASHNAASLHCCIHKVPLEVALELSKHLSCISQWKYLAGTNITLHASLQHFFFSIAILCSNHDQLNFMPSFCHFSVLCSSPTIVHSMVLYSLPVLLSLQKHTLHVYPGTSCQ